MNLQDELVNEINTKIRQVRSCGIPIAVLNWQDIIQEKAARIMAEEMSKDVNIFPGLLVEKCLMQAQAEFCEEKALGKYDENNCEVE